MYLRHRIPYFEVILDGSTPGPGAPWMHWPRYTRDVPSIHGIWNVKICDQTWSRTKLNKHVYCQQEVVKDWLYLSRKESAADTTGCGPARKPNAQSDTIRGSLIRNRPGVRRPSGENTQPNNSSIYYIFSIKLLSSL